MVLDFSCVFGLVSEKLAKDCSPFFRAVFGWMLYNIHSTITWAHYLQKIMYLGLEVLPGLCTIIRSTMTMVSAQWSLKQQSIITMAGPSRLYGRLSCSLCHFATYCPDPFQPFGLSVRSRCGTYTMIVLTR
jgi:hypothetical protein